MLLIDESNDVTFTVNVHGTVSTPTVRCVVGDVPALSFPATKAAGDGYRATIDLPSSMAEGSYPFKVEVLLNGRLFTPISSQINVMKGLRAAEPAPEPVTPVADVPVISPAPAAPQPKPVVRQEAKSMMKAVEETANKKSKTKVQVKAEPVQEERASTIPFALIKGEVIYR